MKYPLLFLLFLFLLSSMFSCGSARRSETVVEPLPELSEKAARGHLVFMDYCHHCHPGGTAGLGPAINNKPLPGFLIKYQVRRGLGVMPSFEKRIISEDQLDDLVTFLKTLRKNDDKRET